MEPRNWRACSECRWIKQSVVRNHGVCDLCRGIDDPTVLVPLAEFSVEYRLGIALLDARLGIWWPWDFDPDTLDMTADGQCLLGQLFGSFARGLDALSEPDGVRPDPAVYGWGAGVGEAHHSTGRYYWKMRQTWQAITRTLRAVRGKPPPARPSQRTRLRPGILQSFPAA